MAGWTRARSNHCGRKTRRARTCVVRGSPRSRLAAAHAGREPGNPRSAGPCGGLLASAVAPAGPDVLVGRSFRNANQLTVIRSLYQPLVWSSRHNAVKPSATAFHGYGGPVESNTAEGIAGPRRRGRSAYPARFCCRDHWRPRVNRLAVSWTHCWGHDGLGLYLSSPGFAIAAILTGHSARRRYPDEAFGRAGLFLGYVAGAIFLALFVLTAITWMSIRAR